MGYVNFSKSEGAVAAERRGKWPATIIAKKLGVRVAAIRDLVEPCEWHHTSKMYNRTYYYDLGECKELLDELKNWKPPAAETEIIEDTTIYYLEWSGSRRHPRAEEIRITGCRVERKDNWCSITTPNGQKIRKNVNTRGFRTENKNGQGDRHETN